MEEDRDEMEVQLNDRVWHFQGWQAWVVASLFTVLGIWMVLALVMGTREIIQWMAQ